jgi:CRISPR-associated endonuclease/helicase Cas3
LLRTWSLLHTRHDLKIPDEIDTLVQAVYEEQVNVPESLRDRLEKALLNSDGKIIAEHGQAHQAIVGLPDDSSWNDPARFVLYDEDQPGVHRTLMAQTRLGEDSVVVIPLWSDDESRPDSTPDFEQAKQWYQRAMSLSRKGVVKKLHAQGVPEGWKESSLLRNCFALLLGAEGRWALDAKVRLDEDLGLVYESTEAE